MKTSLKMLKKLEMLEKLERWAEERVAKGARLLDKHKPGWEQAIPLRFTSAQLQDPKVCVLGKAYMEEINGYANGFDAGIAHLALPHRARDYGFDIAYPPGIDAFDEAIWEALALAWRKEVRKRRGPKS